MKFYKSDYFFKKEFVKDLILICICVVISLMASFLFVKYLIKNNEKLTYKEYDTKLSTGTIKNIFTDSDIIANIAAEVSPSVVYINTELEQTIQSPEVDIFNNDEFFKQFFGFSPFGEENMPKRQLKRKSAGTGSGTIITSDGYILTNYHVVRDASKITVKTRDEKEYKARIVGKDKFSDLAIIKIDEKNLTPARLGDSSKIRPGQWAIAVGSPQGLDNTVTLGIISALSRQIPELPNVSFIQTDAAINPGNSGGPLLNIKGEVVGINTAILGSAQNIGFAIPVNIAKNITGQLKSGQAIGHPWIGIAMAPLNKETLKTLGLSANTHGIAIAKVMPDSPSEASGLTEGDIIQRVDGKRYDKPKDVQNYIRSKKIGDKVNIQILRDGNILGKDVKIGNWGEK